MPGVYTDDLDTPADEWVRDHLLVFDLEVKLVDGFTKLLRGLRLK